MLQLNSIKFCSHFEPVLQRTLRINVSQGALLMTAINHGSPLFFCEMKLFRDCVGEMLHQDVEQEFNLSYIRGFFGRAISWKTAAAQH